MTFQLHAHTHVLYSFLITGTKLQVDIDNKFICTTSVTTTSEDRHI